MKLEKNKVEENNQAILKLHKQKFDFLAGHIPNVESMLKKLMDFQVAIPSWALGTGGTRFARFSGGGEPRTLEEKIEDVGIYYSLRNGIKNGFL